MNNIKQIRSAKGYSQQSLADVLFVNQTAVSQWERGVTSPNQTTLLKMCELFNTTTDYLLGRSSVSSAEPQNFGGVKIPVLGRVQAGVPVEAIQEILDWEEITPEMATKGEYFCLQIKGHSMEPRICDGDVVIVRKQETVENGEVAIVLVNGDEATCKKIVKHSEGITLVAFNALFSPMFYTNREIEQLPIIVIGKVVELRGKF